MFTWSNHPALYCCNSSEQASNVLRSCSDNSSVVADALPNIDEGITVKGSDDVSQKFSTGYVNRLEKSSVVIILRLCGYIGGRKEIKKPITIHTKLTCPTCGIKNRSSHKYCKSCGTYLS